ncbi:MULTISPECIES: hypothetical protein [unclassified Pseudoalteromonas]|uniref:hypothetical protein n=1 Tax=unclassified Pseudoalteromonas TaxID=194690 RepID=UPI002096DA54|nr:hypothetical protein [Pseudoalteromonas sp. XMcav2-N]MCO7189560.1 hypothetical protein [Pseudoalteromonas sp. XMcav2-N]
MNTPTNHSAPVQRVAEYDSGELIYAIGKIQPSFPTLNLEKQYEAAAQSIKASPDDFHTVFNYQVKTDNQPQLTYRPFLYLAQQATWVLTINLIDTYVLTPDTPTQLDALINTTSQAQATYIVNGQMTGLDIPYYSDGTALPMVCVKHLIDSADITVPTLTDGQLASSQLPLPVLKPNVGLSAKDRASNYFLSHFYQIVITNERTLLLQDVQAIHVQPSSAEPARHSFEFIMTSSERMRYACSIDVTNQYPFVSSRLSPFAKSN